MINFRPVMYAVVFLMVFQLAGKAHATWFVYCNEATKQACMDANCTTINPDPDATSTCQLPAAHEGYSRTHTDRCLNAQKSYCELGAGGEGASGRRNPHDVPRWAWYELPPSEDAGVDYFVRCQCGCFPGAMSMLTTRGWQRFDELAKSTASHPFRVAHSRGKEREMMATDFMTAKDFTVGPEEIPVYQLRTDDGKELLLTQKHPVLRERGGELEMVQAQWLEPGDLLVTTEGALVALTQVDTVMLDASDNLVYNVDTRLSDPSERVIHVNGLRMGDVVWQNQLSSREERVKRLTAN